MTANSKETVNLCESKICKGCEDSHADNKTADAGKDCHKDNCKQGACNENYVLKNYKAFKGKFPYLQVQEFP